MKKGTPKSLTEALKDGMDQCLIGYNDKQVEVIRACVQDYLSQKFTFTACMSDEKHQVFLMELFQVATKKEETEHNEEHWYSSRSSKKEESI